jgi:hypothetical protein
MEPRIVEVRFSQDITSPLHKFISAVPALLHTNSESRNEGLRFYELSRQHEKTTQEHSQDAMNRVFFYPAIDTLYLSAVSSGHQRRTLLRERNECDLIHKVQKLCIVPYATIGVSQYLALKEVTLICQGAPIDIHECPTGGLLCLVDIASSTVLGEFGERRLTIKMGEESSKASWKKESLLRGKQMWKCPEIKSVVHCDKVLRPFWVGQEEVHKFLLARAA